MQHSAAPACRRTLPDYAALTRQPLRWTLPWLVVGVLCGVALACWSELPRRTQLIGMLMAPHAVVRAEIAIESAFSGRDPDAARLAMLRMPLPRSGVPGSTPPLLPDAAALQFEGSSFHFDLQALGASAVRIPGLSGTLSWRHAEAGDGATRLWVCGYAQPPAGAVMSPAQNRTTVAPELLPSTCRASR